MFGRSLIFQRHSTVLSISLLILLLVGVMFLISYTMTKHQITMYFHQIFEKKSWSQLEVFHEGTRRQTEDFFAANLAVVENMAQNETLIQSLGKNDLQTSQKILDQQLSTNHRFNSWSVIDQEGTLLVIATEFPDQKRLIGRSFSDRLIFKETIVAQRTTIFPVFGTLTGRNVVSFNVPVFSEGKLTYVISGALVLQGLADKLNLTSTFSDFASVVVSQAGELLLEDGRPVQQKISLGDHDRVITRLLAGEQDVTESEINYRQEPVLARGTALTLNNNTKIILVSYYSVRQFEDEKKNLQREIDDITQRLLLRNGALYLLTISGLAWLMRRHDATAHHP